MRPFTFSTAVSVSWKTWLASVTANIDMGSAFLSDSGDEVTQSPGGHGHVARLWVVQRRELLHASPARGVDDPGTDAPVEAAHQVGIGLGELSERTVQELDPHRTLGGAVTELDSGFEAQAVELVGEHGHAVAGPGPAGEL